MPAATAAGTAPAPAPDGPALRLAGLERRFGDRIALAGVTLDVAAGERVALLGPNGSGKSTLLRILATLLKPTGGRAEVCGLDVVRSAAAVRHRLGTVFQSPSLDGKLSVRENLALQGNLYGLSGALLAGRCAEALTRLGLADRARDRVETLSGGMKRRVELAKVLLHRPAVLLLDEPSTGLDPAARLEFWATLLAVQQERGLTLVVATHLLDEADRCGRAALLNEGRLVAMDTPEALKAQAGGPVLDVETANPASLAPRMEAVLGLRARQIGNALRVDGSAPVSGDAGGSGQRRASDAAPAPGAWDLAKGHETAQRVQRAFPGEVLAVRIGQPTLEDVFLARTGRRLSPEESA